MFPSFTSLSDREHKRQQLLRDIERDLEIDNAKNQAYSEAIWISDVDKANISLVGKTSTSSTQTEPNTQGSTPVSFYGPLPPS
ncbi:uncharacterized protein PHALS_03243, partial [Plasmopara halstedii]